MFFLLCNRSFDLFATLFALLFSDVLAPSFSRTLSKSSILLDSAFPFRLVWFSGLICHLIEKKNIDETNPSLLYKSIYG